MRRALFAKSDSQAGRINRVQGVYGLNESQRAMAVAKVYPEPEHGAAVAKWARLKLPRKSAVSQERSIDQSRKALRRFSSQHGELVAQRQDLRLERSPGPQSQSFLFKAFCGERVGDSSMLE